MTEQEYQTAWQNEPDSKELSEMATEVKRTFAYKKAKEETPTVDIDKEWQRFCANHTIKKEQHKGWHNRWVIAASALLLCTIGLALGWPHISAWKSPKLSQSQPVIVAEQNVSNSILEDTSKLTFRDAELRAILQELATRHEAQVRYRCAEEIRLYVELEKAWTLQQCVDFLNHFERVNLKLTSDNIIVAE